MNQLGIFAKFWQPGRVKTRLAAQIGEAAASRLYRGFLASLLQRLAGCGQRRCLVYSPTTRRPAFTGLLRTMTALSRGGHNARPRHLTRHSVIHGARHSVIHGARHSVIHGASHSVIHGASRCLCFGAGNRRRSVPPSESLGWQLVPQGGGDLGERLGRHFRRALAGGARRVVVIGSDSPTLPPGLIQQAFELLHRHDVVLGPTDDGGYYLIGARDHVPPVFDDIAWSTDQVWEQTLDRLQARGRSYATLSRWYDIDNLMDLHRLRDELQELPADGTTRRLAATVARTLAGLG